MQKQSETEMKNSELSVKLSLLEREKEAEPEMEEKVSSHLCLILHSLITMRSEINFPSIFHRSVL